MKEETKTRRDCRPPMAHTPIHLMTQVGGHADRILTSEDGSLLFKRTNVTEHAFYDSVSSSAKYASLIPFIPKYIGKLKFEGKQDHLSGELTVSVEPQSEFVVIENIVNNFLKPNILDVKLGTKLYDESATPEKKSRMEKAAAETTSKQTGIRLTGFQVYDNLTGEPVLIPKSYGKSITAAQLSDGIALFFPAGTPSHHSSATLLQILGVILVELRVMKRVVEKVEMRMVGGSVLIVYESDASRANTALDELKSSSTAAVVEEKDDDAEGDEEISDEDDELDEKMPQACAVKLIDFAHTKFTPGEGPDSGVLLGLDTLIHLLEGRIRTLTASP